jgi:hypothetical protein
MYTPCTTAAYYAAYEGIDANELSAQYRRERPPPAVWQWDGPSTVDGDHIVVRHCLPHDFAL